MQVPLPFNSNFFTFFLHHTFCYSVDILKLSLILNADCILSLSYSFFDFIFPYFLFQGLALDQSGHPVSFCAHVNLPYRIVPVSYTHLTLPTILRV